MHHSLPFALTDCQKRALRALTETHDNIFLTGCAGSGKSFLIKEFLKTKDKKTFPVLASTGSAAVLIGGRTFHSFFGLGIMQGGFDVVVDKALKNKQVLKRLKSITSFVLDEVSMIPGDALRAAETICGYARQKPHLPWGGARVIAVGDFAQLPPVSPGNSEKPWAFLDPVWQKTQFVPFVLKTLVRSQDEEFLQVLGSVRQGVVTPKVQNYLNERTFEDIQDTRDIPYFFPLRKQSEDLNTKRLADIPNELYEFATTYQGVAHAIESLKKNLFLPEVLRLKKSAFVMIRINDPAYKFVNGSLGHILEIDEQSEKTILHIQLLNKRIVEIEKMHFSVLDAEGEPLATAENFPVTLAYATTIHKSQGMTVDRMCVDLRHLWEPGQAYVALSRLRTGAGLNLLGWSANSIRVDQQVMRFYEELG